MKKIFLSIAFLHLFVTSTSAAIITLAFSPAAGDALNPVNYANGDHTLAMSAPNAVGQPASPATGDIIGAGITLDDVTGLLSYNLAYGSDFGFVDLTGSFSVAHIHGPVAVQFPAANTGAGVFSGLTHTAGSSANTGSFSGSVFLSAAQQADLLDNLYYINIHSSTFAGGEIRGQLVAVPEPSVAGIASLAGLVFLTLRRRC